jgi:predicted nucleotidyltransferase
VVGSSAVLRLNFSAPKSASSQSRKTLESIELLRKKVYLYVMITPQQENIIKTVTQRVKPTLVGVFGSYAREEENEKSDLDILIDFDMKVDLLELIGLEQELSELLGIKVDLITLRSVNASLKPYIESDLIRLV